MYWNRRFLLGLLVLIACSPGFASIIDDKSDFVGDYTVMDFESYGDGTPLILGDGRFTKIANDEYAPLGITITVSYDIAFDDYCPVVANPLSSQFDAALVAAGSLENAISDRSVNGFLRFDFMVPVNAVGLTVINRAGGDPVRLEVFGPAGVLLDSVAFDDPLIDGIIPGEDFDSPFDMEYGFFGLFLPDEEIAYGMITEGSTRFDDLHFGVIPEPGTLGLLALGAIGLGRR